MACHAVAYAVDAEGEEHQRAEHENHAEHWISGHEYGHGPERREHVGQGYEGEEYVDAEAGLAAEHHDVGEQPFALGVETAVAEFHILVGVGIAVGVYKLNRVWRTESEP